MLTSIFWGSAQHIFRLPLHQSKRFGWINQFLDRQKEREYSHQKYGWNRIRRSAGKAGCCLFGKTARRGESWTCPAHPEQHQVGGVNAGTLPKIAAPRRSAGKAGCCLFGKTARRGESWTCPAHPEQHQVGGVNAGTLPKIAAPLRKNCSTPVKNCTPPFRKPQSPSFHFAHPFAPLQSCICPLSLSLSKARRWNALGFQKPDVEMHSVLAGTFLFPLRIRRR